jgi:hypothetical protein
MDWHRPYADWLGATSSWSMARAISVFVAAFISFMVLLTRHEVPWPPWTGQARLDRSVSEKVRGRQVLSHLKEGKIFRIVKILLIAVSAAAEREGSIWFRKG